VIKWDGQKIGKPGIYSGVPIDAYHGDLCIGPSVSSSGLRTIESKTPLHFYAGSYLNPDRVAEERNEAFNFGRAAHTLLLGESDFRDKYVVRPDEYRDWRTKAAQQWRGDQEAAGKTVLIPSQITAIRGIARSLETHPLVKQGILYGLVEHTIVCQDKATGVWLKIRPDVVPAADGVLVDAKSTEDASPEAVRRSILNYGYPMQGALGTIVMKEALDLTITDFVLLFFEKKEPHAIAITAIDNEWVSYARRQVRRSIDKFAHCVESGEWPGYDNETTVYMPDWLRKRLEQESDVGLLPEEIAA
jgi:hypothetical protein